MQIARRQDSDDEARNLGPHAAAEAGVWVRVCRLEDIAPNTGVGALLGKRQIAVVRVQSGGADSVYALSNFDPFSKAFVLSRGIVGDRQGAPKIASPIYKQSFDLRSGACLDDATVKVPTFLVRVEGGVVEVFQPAEGDAT
jgi:nitrite reductase (NADH) small subunit